MALTWKTRPDLSKQGLAGGEKRPTQVQSIANLVRVPFHELWSRLVVAISRPELASNRNEQPGLARR